MDKQEALILLACNEGDSEQTISTQYHELLNEHQIRLDQAPTPNLRKLYQKKLEDLAIAYELIGKIETSGDNVFSDSTDLPTSEPPKLDDNSYEELLKIVGGAPPESEVKPIKNNTAIVFSLLFLILVGGGAGYYFLKKTIIPPKFKNIHFTLDSTSDIGLLIGDLNNTMTGNDTLSSGEQLNYRFIHIDDDMPFEIDTHTGEITLTDPSMIYSDEIEKQVEVSYGDSTDVVIITAHFSINQHDTDASDGDSWDEDLWDEDPREDEPTEKQYIVGSTTEEIDTAMNLCEKYDQGVCERDWFATEKMREITFTGAFVMDAHEVTNSDFSKFVDAQSYQTDAERTGEALIATPFGSILTRGYNWKYPEGPDKPSYKDRPNFPVVFMSQNDAIAYCQWAQKRLPSRDEWEITARGEMHTQFPWGNEWSAQAVQWQNNTNNATLKPIKSFPQGKTEQGIYDLSGSVWEWTSSAGSKQGEAILKGGSWLESNPAFFRNATERSEEVTAAHSDNGFRCVTDI